MCFYQKSVFYEKTFLSFLEFDESPGKAGYSPVKRKSGVNYFKRFAGGLLPDFYQISRSGEIHPVQVTDLRPDDDIGIGQLRFFQRVGCYLPRSE